jgi:hypothetical protein
VGAEVKHPETIRGTLLLVAAAIIAIVSSLCTWAASEAWRWYRADPPALRVNCGPELSPVTVTDPDTFIGIALHPKWDGKTQTTVGAAGTTWPSLPTGVGFKCVLRNAGEAPLSGIALPLTVRFRNAKIGVQDYVNTMTVPFTIEPREFVLVHLADDTGADPEVRLPTSARGRVGTSLKIVEIHLLYATKQGEPPTLSGWGGPTK